ncbi:hypothetical protein AJ78_01669 [Emergomyces pasteurianus Ep9510]|uniref:Thioesterase domain-containing protein n=1 Tax=Emergomyces pasteurianus Ep9510 TaxID=1447872 RepID=A0A1J9QSP3_9EURO|nr:hypothetical protein AJ78_01669 [Emergomyces pasteurianus Ep9510]
MPNDDAARRRARDSIESFLGVYKEIMKEKNFTGYDRQLMQDLRLIDVNPAGGAIWELTVTEFWSNLNGVMHGGAYGVIFDMCTAISMCPISRDGYWEFLAGVTRSLNISYLKAVPIGTTVYIRANIIQHGRTMALMSATMESRDGKVVYATAEHHKVNTPALPEYVRKLKERRQQKEEAKL